MVLNIENICLYMCISIKGKIPMNVCQNCKLKFCQDLISNKMSYGR